MKWGQDKPGATRSLATSNRLGNIIEPGQYRAETSYSPHSEHRLSGTFLQTPSIAFRHLPPNSEHRFLALSSKLRDLFPAPSSKLRVSLSGTFLQTLPDLVTPLKGHSLSPPSCPPTRSAPSEDDDDELMLNVLRCHLTY